MDEQLPGNSIDDLQKFREEEVKIYSFIKCNYKKHSLIHTIICFNLKQCKMITNDEKEKDRVDARNALEEYVYDMREKLSEDGSLSTYIEGNQRQNICQQLNDLENWLYEEGEDCENEVYRSKLTDLHNQTDPIKARSFEYEQQPNAFNDLGHAVQMARKSVNEFRSNAPKYDHITETEILNITEAADRSQRWLEENSGRLAKTSKTIDPAVRISDIRHELQTLTACVNSVLNRPKPKPPTPPATNNTSTAGNNDSNSDKQSKEDGFEPTLSEDKMDVE